MESFLDSGKVFDLDPEGWICYAFLSSFRKTTWATGSKEDVEKAPGLSPGPATQMAQLRWARGQAISQHTGRESVGEFIILEPAGCSGLGM